VLLPGPGLQLWDKHNRSEMVAVLRPNEALPYYIHTYSCGISGTIKTWRPLSLTVNLGHDYPRFDCSSV
jgi:hypothetical protein